MGAKILDYTITVLAVIGVILIIGAVGSSDYAEEIGQNLSTLAIIKTMIFGLLLTAPAIIRGVM